MIQGAVCMHVWSVGDWYCIGLDISARSVILISVSGKEKARPWVDSAVIKGRLREAAKRTQKINLQV